MESLNLQLRNDSHVVTASPSSQFLKIFVTFNNDQLMFRIDANSLSVSTLKVSRGWFPNFPMTRYQLLSCIIGVMSEIVSPAITMAMPRLIQ